MRLPPQSAPVISRHKLEPYPERIEILEAFAEMPDVRNPSGKRHQVALCLALFTLAVAAGNRGFLAMGDWLKSYRSELIALFHPPQQRLPSYSTIRRVLLTLDYQQYSAALARFFGIEPLPGETLAVDGKVLRGSYQLETDNPDSPPHPGHHVGQCVSGRTGPNSGALSGGEQNQRNQSLARIYQPIGIERCRVCL